MESHESALRMLNHDEHERLTAALYVWLQGHTTPDEPAFHLGQWEGAHSPRELVDAVARRDELGEAIIAILEFGIRRTSLEAVVEDFQATGRWGSGGPTIGTSA
jgi:hypothetical protein